MTANPGTPSLSVGLQFKKFDLHVHTPASDDYRGKKDIEPCAIVDTALAKGLAGIAITDHQSGEWINRVKEAARGKNLVVFPGVELLVTGGEGGVHILILFDVDKDSKHVEQFLNSLGIYDKRGERTLAAELTPGQVADKLEKYDASALLILPHCHSSKGVLGDMRGETRSMIFEARHKCIMGAEASESDFTNEGKKATHKRVIDLLDGSDENYHYRKLGVYSSSDAHSPEEIGRAFTHLKVDEPISIEDIRQAFVDRETRIRQPFQLEAGLYPQIKTLTIDSGFLANQQFDFHPGLNSILGAKGAGKSLAIEFLRFALNQPPVSAELLADHNSKVEKCLKTHGTVNVFLSDESGREYLVMRTYNPGEGNPTSILDATDGSEKCIEVDEFFPVLFLSQGEVAKIAEDRTGASQRQFIDKFFDFHRFQHRIEELTRQLREADDRFAQTLKAHLESVELKKKIATCKEETLTLERQIQDPVFVEFARKQQTGRAIQAQADFLDSLRTSLISVREEYANLTAPSAGNTATDSEPSVKRAVDHTKGVIAEIQRATAALVTILDTEKAEIEKEYRRWEALFKPVKETYDQAVKATGGTQVNLNQRRQQVLADMSKYESAVSRAQGKVNLATTVAQQRKDLLDKLDIARKEYFEERKSRCEFFTTESMGALDVTIRESEDRTTFKNNLLNLKRGSWLKDEDVERISKGVTPRKFVASLMRYEGQLREKNDPLNVVVEATGMKPEIVQKLADHLLDTYGYKDILGLLYTSVPEDVPSIRYRVEDTYKDLAELSVGQKAVALLIIALSDGSFPIVVDQPEDSLDLRTIWDDLCAKLRGKKERRQFIFTTHNSSVAVASDTDKFTILQATADQGTVMFSGSLNRQNMRKEVVSYLEGGEPTYFLKRSKYDL
jgi:hypothetical protein